MNPSCQGVAGGGQTPGHTPNGPRSFSEEIW